MNRIILLLSVFVFSSTITFSQDTIFTKNDKIISSKVLEVLPQEIKFKKSENPDGPLYTMKKSEIKKIVYENGSVDIFNVAATEDENFYQEKITSQIIIHSGLTFATLWGDTEQTKHKLGFAGGFSIEIPIDLSLRNYFDFTILYEQKGTGYNDFIFEYDGSYYEMSNVTEELDYFSLAGTIKRYFGNKQILFGRFGAYIGYLYKATLKGDLKSTEDGQTTNINVSNRDYYTVMDFGGTIGLGIKLPLIKGKFQTDFIFDIRYNIGLSNILDNLDNTPSSGTKEFNSDFVVLIGLKFPF